MAKCGSSTWKSSSSSEQSKDTTKGSQGWTTPKEAASFIQDPRIEIYYWMTSNKRIPSWDHTKAIVGRSVRSKPRRVMESTLLLAPMIIQSGYGILGGVWSLLSGILIIREPLKLWIGARGRMESSLQLEAVGIERSGSGRQSSKNLFPTRKQTLRLAAYCGTKTTTCC